MFTIDTSDKKVTALPVKKRPDPNDAQYLEVVHVGKCRHNHYLIDESKAEVECGLCHEKLNPMYVLLELAKQETRWNESRKAYIKEHEAINARRKTKCQHCGQMTRIRGI